MSVLSDFLPAGGAGGALVYKRELFTTSGTWTKPAGIWQNQVWVTAIGGGSSGNSSNTGLSGSSGQIVIRKLVDVSGTSSETVTIGAGGASVIGSGANQPGNSGSATSFGALLSVNGGPAPVASYTTTRDAFGSSLNGCNPGTSEQGGNNVPSTIGGVFAAPLNYCYSNMLGGSGLMFDESTPIAGSSSDTTPNRAGFPGQGYGAGGAAAGNDATSNSENSGAGADGAVLVEWYEEA